MLKWIMIVQVLYCYRYIKDLISNFLLVLCRVHRPEIINSAIVLSWLANKSVHVQFHKNKSSKFVAYTEVANLFLTADQKINIHFICFKVLLKYAIFKYCKHMRGAYDKFPDFFCMDTFIDGTHMKL